MRGSSTCQRYNKISDENGYAVNTPDRNTLWQIQTPQSFEYELIMDAYEKMIKDSARGNITEMQWLLKNIHQLE